MGRSQLVQLSSKYRKLIKVQNWSLKVYSVAEITIYLKSDAKVLYLRLLYSCPVVFTFPLQIPK